MKVDYENRDAAALVADVNKAIDQKVKFDRARKYRLAWGRPARGLRSAPRRASGSLSRLVLAAIMVLLYAEFGLLRQAFLIVGVVPLATLGAGRDPRCI